MPYQSYFEDANFTLCKQLFYNKYQEEEMTSGVNWWLACKKVPFVPAFIRETCWVWDTLLAKRLGV